MRKIMVLVVFTFLLVQEVTSQRELVWTLGGLLVGNQIGYQRGFNQGYYFNDPWYYNNTRVYGNWGGGVYFNEPAWYDNRIIYYSDPWCNRYNNYWANDHQIIYYRESPRLYPYIPEGRRRNRFKTIIIYEAPW